MNSANSVMQTLVVLMIVTVSVLFTYSLINPVEKSRRLLDEQTIAVLLKESSQSSRCFKPVSQYYQSDVRSVYDAKGNMVFEGYLCFK